jgi:hypothetical protein
MSAGEVTTVVEVGIARRSDAIPRLKRAGYHQLGFSCILKYSAISTDSIQ